MGTVLFIYLVTLARAVAARELTLDTVHTPWSSVIDREQLDLCDCRPASGDPEGLSCDAEGYVVAGFERHGVYLVADSADLLLTASHSVSPIGCQVNGSSAEILCR